MLVLIVEHSDHCCEISIALIVGAVTAGYEARESVAAFGDLKKLQASLSSYALQRKFLSVKAFALNYIRRGGSVFHLQKALGDSSSK